MDGLIKRFDAVADRDLMLCAPRGVAYQRDMGLRAAPGVNADGQNYFEHYAAFEGNEIARKLHHGRVQLVDTWVSKDTPVLDVGVGSGEFIKARPNTQGMDVNPVAVDWLRRRGLLADRLDRFQAFTFWDVLEHVDVPNNYFKRMPDNCHLFTSLPIFGGLDQVRGSKHYKPGEHLYYWTEPGFVEWMAMYRFRLLQRSDVETRAGRDSILSFAFKRDLPGYHDTLEQYQKLHAAAYGTTGYLYFDAIAREVLALDPRSILDFGCGRSDLAAHFWGDGRRRIAKYDPAIPQFKELPDGEFDLTLCTDVMEHIPIGDVERVLRDMRAKAARALFTISMKPARAKLPDGRNAHVTLLSASEWLRWIGEVFGRATALPTQWEHILMVKTF